MKNFMDRFRKTQNNDMDNRDRDTVSRDEGIINYNRTDEGPDYLVQNLNDIFAIITPEGIIKYISSMANIIFGHSPEEMTDKNLFDFCCSKEFQNIKSMVDVILRNPSKTTVKNIRRESDSGEEIFFEVRMTNYLKEPYINGILVNFRNISRRVKLEQTVDYMSNYDKNTELPNHIYFLRRMKEVCIESRKSDSAFALMMLDIDDFKYINNNLGYACGDQLIIDVGKRITNIIDGKACICRYLGDQFAIIVEKYIDIETCEELAREILKVFDYPFILDKFEAYITASMGISIFPDDGKSGDSMERSANKALFYAKSEGKNMYKFYSAGGDISSFKHFELRNDLYKAIEKNQLNVFFQPIVNIKTGTILAAESLVRWAHPTWGLVTANEFIGLAEDTELILDIGKWVLREVCRQYSEWLKKGMPKIKVSINYLSIQLFEADFIAKIKKTIREYRLDPSFLIIEVSENVLTQGDNNLMENIKSLQEEGIEVAIDNFGVGISSIAHLSLFDIDILKLDRSFIKDIPENTKSTRILQSLVSLSLELDLKLIINGIENWDQLSYLRGLNCHMGQGYLFSKALPAKLFTRVLARKAIRPAQENTSTNKPYVEKRRFFRISFNQLLEASMAILELGGKTVNAGRTKILIKNIGPGGLCFISNINLPVKRDLILQFQTELLDKTLELKGRLAWSREIDDRFSEYGVEFIVDENERTELIKHLNQVQIRMRNNIMFAEGKFIEDSFEKYFEELNP